MTKIFADIFGVLLLLLGILGFIPEVTPHGMLLKIFQVNHSLNFIHLFSGIAALWCGLSSTLAARVYFRFFGLLYGLIAVMGALRPTWHAAWSNHEQYGGYVAARRPCDHVSDPGFAPTREPAALPVI